MTVGISRNARTLWWRALLALCMLILVGIGARVHALGAVDVAASATRAAGEAVAVQQGESVRHLMLHTRRRN